MKQNRFKTGFLKLLIVILFQGIGKFSLLLKIILPVHVHQLFLTLPFHSLTCGLHSTNQAGIAAERVFSRFLLRIKVRH